MRGAAHGAPASGLFDRKLELNETAHPTPRRSSVRCQHGDLVRPYETLVQVGRCAVPHKVPLPSVEVDAAIAERGQPPLWVGVAIGWCVSSTFYPIPYTLYPIPYTLYPVPYTLYPEPYILFPIP